MSPALARVVALGALAVIAFAASLACIVTAVLRDYPARTYWSLAALAFVLVGAASALIGFGHA